VRASLAEERKRQMVYTMMQDLADKARAALTKNPRAAESVARELGVDFIRAEKVPAGGDIPGIGVSRELHEALSGLRPGEVTSIVQVSPTRLAVAAVAEIEPARQAELADVESTVRQRVTAEKLTRIVEERAKEAMEKARAMNGDLRKLAQSMGLTWKLTPPFTRDGAAEGLGAAAYVEEAFSLEPGALFGPVTVGDQKFICKVAAKKPADMSGLAAERDSIVETLKQRKARERVEIMQQNLRDVLVKQGKLKIHQDVINRLVESYRSRVG